MKKIILFLTISLSLFSFFSCDSDEDNASIDERFVGSWRFTRIYVSKEVGWCDWDDLFYQLYGATTVTFKEDASYVANGPSIGGRGFCHQDGDIIVVKIKNDGTLTKTITYEPLSEEGDTIVFSVVVEDEFDSNYNDSFIGKCERQK